MQLSWWEKNRSLIALFETWSVDLLGWADEIWVKQTDRLCLPFSAACDFLSTLFRPSASFSSATCNPAPFLFQVAEEEEEEKEEKERIEEEEEEAITKPGEEEKEQATAPLRRLVLADTLPKPQSGVRLLLDPGPAFETQGAKSWVLYRLFPPLFLLLILFFIVIVVVVIAFLLLFFTASELKERLWKLDFQTIFLF